MTPSKHWVWAVALAVLLALPAAGANAQVMPPENHYKTYETGGPSVTIPVTLRDQFGTYNVSGLVLTKFANPANKNDEGYYDENAHQTWWDLSIPQVQRIVTATDQFGENDWNVFAAVYLLVPAWKNESAPGTEPPTWNHYLCYEANGPLVNVPVTLVDQFGSITTTVMEGKYFCNPVEKTVEGQVYPMIDPQAHLTCYMIDDDNVYDIDVTATDQFGWWQLNVNDSYCLCTPAWKGDVVRAEASTWGKIKALYQ